MRLDSVEIVGFKSFCDRQEVSFKAGVTGIVGPNGCGKSNISDAISWVLGEQSVKSLRGTSMEDVIFNGSSSRQPLQMAEVNLKVSGLNGSSPDGSPECTVTRRLYRNGESEYLMNGRVCRLRDIHELFMDTGLGSKAYSIIEQGKIGQILSSRPTDRRAIIEEAAGITKYKARRRQTQLKLDAAQQNLLRVNDIVNEVEKQLESLKRQAAKARRWRAVREEMQGVERVLFGRRFLDLRERAGALEERHAAEAGREGAASLALETEEAQLEARRQSLYELEARLERARGRLGELTLAVDRHQGRGGYCRQQLAENAGRAEQAAREEQDLVSRVGPLTETLAGRRGEEQRLHEELAAAETELRAAEAAVAQATARQAEAEAALERGRDSQVALLGRIATLQNSRASVAGNADRAAADLLKLGAEIEALERERERVHAARDAARARGQAAEATLARLTTARDAATGRADEARARAEARGREADALQSERDGLAGRRASLEEMVATHSAFDEGVRALLAGPEGIEVHGVVADALETGSEHERALEAFLGDRLQAVLVPDAEQARRGIRWLQSSGAGPRGLPAPRFRAHPPRVRAPARDRRAGVEGAGAALRLLPRRRPTRRPHPRLAPRRSRGGHPRGRARGGVAAGTGPGGDPRGRDPPRGPGRGRPRRDGPPRPAARGQGGRHPTGGDRGSASPPCAPPPPPPPPRPQPQPPRPARSRRASTPRRRAWSGSATRSRPPKRSRGGCTARAPSSTPSALRPRRSARPPPSGSPRSSRPSAPPRPSGRRATFAWPGSAPRRPRAAPPPRPRRRATRRPAARSPRCASGPWPRRTSAGASRGTSWSSSSGSPPPAPTPRRRKPAGSGWRTSSPRSSDCWRGRSSSATARRARRRRPRSACARRGARSRAGSSA
jgi:energy-coupling factor transporter ATP-binding protein EcfA2